MSELLKDKHVVEFSFKEELEGHDYHAQGENPSPRGWMVNLP